MLHGSGWGRLDNNYQSDLINHSGFNPTENPKYEPISGEKGLGRKTRC